MTGLAKYKDEQILCRALLYVQMHMLFLTDCLSSSHKQSQAWSHNHIVRCFSSQRIFYSMQHWNTVCFFMKTLVCCWFSFILLFTFKS